MFQKAHFFAGSILKRWSSFDRRNIKRFYKNVNIAQVPSAKNTQFEILLDHRKLRTPSEKVFSVPHIGLAHAIAQEWDAQSPTINRSRMHLTQICNTVLDNPTNRSKSLQISGILEYLDTDTIIFWANEDDDSGGDLLKKQKAQWGPVLDFVREKYQITPQISQNFLARPVLQPADREKLEKYLLSMNPWALCSFQNITESLKSFYLSLALTDGFIDSEKSVSLSLLETSHQEDKWGNVPWYHDVERADVCARVSSALIVFLTSFEQRQVKQVTDSAFMRSHSSQ